jgi:hypothetical protein
MILLILHLPRRRLSPKSQMRTEHDSRSTKMFASLHVVHVIKKKKAADDDDDDDADPRTILSK